MSEKDLELQERETIRSSINDAAKYVSNLYINFLLLMIYIAITVFSTTDEQLLRESSLPLPLLNAPLPLEGFYVVIPFAFIVFHIYMLLQVLFLSRKLHYFNDTVNEKEKDKEWMLLYPFVIISPITIQREKSPIIRRLVQILLWVSIVVIPPVLLLLTQIWFLPYHSIGITRITSCNFVAVVIDSFLLLLIWKQIKECPMIDDKTISMQYFFEPLMWSVKRSRIGMVCLLLPIASFLVLIVPNKLLDTLGITYHILPRNLILKDETLVKTPPLPEVVAFYIQQGKSEEEAWRDHTIGLPLSIRNLCYADFSHSRLYNADLRGANLEGAHLDYTELEGASFDSSSKLQGVNGVHTDFQGASLSDAQLTGATLVNAKLQGVNLTGAHLENAKLMGSQLQGADLSYAHLQGAKLISALLVGTRLGNAELQGVNLDSAQLNFANLSDAQLQGTYLSCAQLQGVDLNSTNLQDAKLPYAQLQGVDLCSSNLQGAILTHTDLKGATLSYANLQGANFEDTNLELCDLRNVKIDRLTKFGTNTSSIDILYNGTIQGLPKSISEKEYIQKFVPFFIDSIDSSSTFDQGLSVRPDNFDKTEGPTASNSSTWWWHPITSSSTTNWWLSGTESVKNGFLNAKDNYYYCFAQRIIALPISEDTCKSLLQNEIKKRKNSKNLSDKVDVIFDWVERIKKPNSTQMCQ